jgi:hypothetical protein
MHAGHESMHTEERAQGAGMGCSLARGWAERASGLRTRPNPESSCLSASAPRTAAPSAGEERLGDAVLARSWARRTPHRTPNEVRRGVPFFYTLLNYWGAPIIKAVKSV